VLDVTLRQSPAASQGALAGGPLPLEPPVLVAVDPPLEPALPPASPSPRVLAPPLLDPAPASGDVVVTVEVEVEESSAHAGKGYPPSDAACFAAPMSRDAQASKRE